MLLRDPWMYALSGLFAVFIAVWFFFDHSYPFWDAAAHIKDSIAYAELFRHPAFWDVHWLHRFLTVNPQYPWAVHAFNGALRCVVGYGRLADALSLCIFGFIMSASVYGIAMTTLNSRLAAVVAVVLINCYPEVSIHEHLPMLDFPQLSLYCLAILCLILWKKSPSWRTAIGAACAVTLAVMSKQTAALFLIGPAILLLGACRKRSEFAQLGLVALITAVALGLWVMPNIQELRLQRAYPGPPVVEQVGLLKTFCDNFASYLNHVPGIISPALFILFVGSFIVACFARKEIFARLSLPLVGSTVGFVLVCCLRCMNIEDRYVLPIVLPIALLTAGGITSSGKLRPVAVGAITFALGQFVWLNYCPYPIPIQREKLIESIAPTRNPTPPGDPWGQEWAISTIKTAENGRSCWLAVMPSTPELSVHTLDLLAIYSGAGVKPSTFRRYTLHGDVVTNEAFNSERYFDWFLLKTGFQGQPLKNEESTANYNRLLDNVQTSGKFHLAAQRQIADGSTLQLYRRQ